MPTVSDVRDLMAQLDQAMAQGHLANAIPLVREARRLIASGELTGSDHAALSIKLSGILSKLEALDVK